MDVCAEAISNGSRVEKNYGGAKTLMKSADNAHIGKTATEISFGTLDGAATSNKSLKNTKMLVKEAGDDVGSLLKSQKAQKNVQTAKMASGQNVRVVPMGDVKPVGKKSGKMTKGHTAKWEHLDGHGKVIDSGISQSGGTNPGRVLSWEEQLETHTERKILKELNEKGTVLAGDTIIIYGTKPPCNPGRSTRPSRGCQKAMQDFSKEPANKKSRLN